METEIVTMSENLEARLKETVQNKNLQERLNARIALRNMSADYFIEKHGSGTLRKNKRIGMAWWNQYLTERTAYEFGWGFEITQRCYVKFGDAKSEGDCHPITEAGWHIERYLEMHLFPEDHFETKYIEVENKDGITKEGIGLIVRRTSAPFIPKGHIVYAIVTEYDPMRECYKEALNPS